jgi:hypothetical protein
MLNHKTTLLEEHGTENLQRKRVLWPRRDAHQERSKNRFPHLRTTKTQARSRAKERKENSPKEPVTRKISTSSTKQVTSRNKRNSETVDGQGGAGKIDTQQKARQKTDETFGTTSTESERPKNSLTFPTVRTARIRAKRSNELKQGSSPQRMMATLATGGTTTFRSVRLVSQQ